SEIDDDLYIIEAMENIENNDIKSPYSILLNNRNDSDLIEAMDRVVR
ncbi:29793_t:CDS:1, partial [Gigaspora margarita]